MTIYTYQGLIFYNSWEEAEDIIYLSSLSEPLAEELQYKIKGKQVTARYWITDIQVSKEEAQEQFLKTVMGVGETDFGSVYSEYTGYLWTDEKCKIGGHDLIEEMRSNVGKWVILELEIH